MRKKYKEQKRAPNKPCPRNGSDAISKRLDPIGLELTLVLFGFCVGSQVGLEGEQEGEGARRRAWSAERIVRALGMFSTAATDQRAAVLREVAELVTIKCGDDNGPGLWQDYVGQLLAVVSHRVTLVSHSA
jgi:hypothetical protein